MKLDHILKHVLTLLQEENRDAAIIGGEEGSSQERLLLFLGNDEKGRERVLEITAQDQELGTAVKEEVPNLARVQFQVLFPFKMDERSAKEVGGLLCYLNRQLEMPGLEMSEIDDQIFYRYILLTTHEELNKTLVVAIIGVILFILQVYADLIEAVASGSMTFNHVLEKIIEANDLLESSE